MCRRERVRKKEGELLKHAVVSTHTRTIPALACLISSRVGWLAAAFLSHLSFSLPSMHLFLLTHTSSCIWSLQSGKQDGAGASR